MKLEFEKPMLLNYIRTKQGLFALGHLTKKEITEYTRFWVSCLKLKYEEKVKVIK